MKTVNWGIVGCGNVCERKSGPAMYKTPHSVLAAVMRRDAEKAADFARRHNVPKSYTAAVTAAFRFRSGVTGTGTWCFVAPPQAVEDSVAITGRKGHTLQHLHVQPHRTDDGRGYGAFPDRPSGAHSGSADRNDRRRTARRGALSLDGNLGRENIPGHGPDHIRIKSLSLHPMELKNYDKEERFDPATVEALKGHYTEILRLLGEDPAREGLLKTPERVAKAMSFLTKGYDENPLEIIRSATFREEYKQMVLVKDIELYSMCEHHMLPFYGKAHVAYIPNGRITGLSKIARVVECFARRLQVQERLTVQIRDCIQEALNPMGVAVVIEASHMCMQMRGIEKQQSATTTSAFTGIFLSDHRTREEFMTLISHRYR